MKRVILFENGTDVNGKVFMVTHSIEELLKAASIKFAMICRRVFTPQGGEIDDIKLIRDDDILFVSTGEDFLPGNKSAGMRKHEWVTLNVGGKLFATTQSTLTQREPMSMLARMFTENEDNEEFRISPSSTDSSGAFLIDRSPTYFEPLLNYLRHGQLILDKNVSAAGVLEEARFYGIDGVLATLEDMVAVKDQQIKGTEALTRRDVLKAIMSTSAKSELRFQGVNLAGADLSRLDLRNINFKAQRFRDRCRDDDDYYQSREIHGSRSPLRIFTEHGDPDFRIADYELESNSRLQPKDSGHIRRSFIPPAEILRVSPTPRTGSIDRLNDRLFYSYRRSFEDPKVPLRRKSKGKGRSHINVAGINTNVNVADHSGYIAKDNSPPAETVAEPKSSEGPEDADKGSEGASASSDIIARRDSGMSRPAPDVEGTAQVVYVSGKTGHYGVRRMPTTKPPLPPTTRRGHKSLRAPEVLNFNENRNVNPNKHPGGPKVGAHLEAHRRSFGRVYRPHLNDNQNLNININRPLEEETPPASQYYYTYY